MKRLKLLLPSSKFGTHIPKYFTAFSSEAINFVRNQLREHGDVQVTNFVVAFNRFFKKMFITSLFIIIVFFFQVASEALAQMALVINDFHRRFHLSISLQFTFLTSPKLHFLLLQDQYSQDNVTIVIADLGYGIYALCKSCSTMIFSLESQKLLNIN